MNSVICLKLEPIKQVQSETSSSLQSDLNDFLNIISVDDIRNLTEFFYINDQAMRESYDYLRDDGVKMAVNSLRQLSLVKKFTTFLNDTGVNFAELGKRIERIVLTRDEAKSLDGNCSKT
jgi:site-specific recombinase XerD